MRFKDNVAIVTGCNTGIGEAIALAFGKEGARVVLADCVTDNLEAHAKKIKASGGRALSVKTDISSLDSVKDMAAKAVGEFGRIDILVNNAAYTNMSLKPFMNTEPHEWDGEINTTFRGTLNCCWAVLPQMVKQNYGRIVNITTAGVKTGSQFLSLYGASKAAVAQFTKSLAMEVMQHGILVNAVAPGMIKTGALNRVFGEDLLKTHLATQGVSRLGESEEVARVVLFLSSDEASYVTGQHWSACGGLSPQ